MLVQLLCATCALWRTRMLAQMLSARLRGTEHLPRAARSTRLVALSTRSPRARWSADGPASECTGPPCAARTLASCSTEYSPRATRSTCIVPVVPLRALASCSTEYSPRASRAARSTCLCNGWTRARVGHR
eukprot:963506-Rhodomonas_salina.1